MCPVRHLTERQAVSALERGATIEQMLSSDLDGGSFRWLSAAREDDVLVLRLHETCDDGGPDFLDVYDFTAVNPDDEFGTGVAVASASDATELIGIAVASGARVDRWVSGGVIQDEYSDLLLTR